MCLKLQGLRRRLRNCIFLTETTIKNVFSFITEDEPSWSSLYSENNKITFLNNVEHTWGAAFIRLMSCATNFWFVRFLTDVYSAEQQKNACAEKKIKDERRIFILLLLRPFKREWWLFAYMQVSRWFFSLFKSAPSCELSVSKNVNNPIRGNSVFTSSHKHHHHDDISPSDNSQCKTTAKERRTSERIREGRVINYILKWH
jgi:hypothetical protein